MAIEGLNFFGVATLLGLMAFALMVGAVTVAEEKLVDAEACPELGGVDWYG